MYVGLVTPETVRENLFQASLPPSGVCGNPWYSLACGLHHPDLCFCCHMESPFLCVSLHLLSSSHEDTSHQIRTHSDDLILTKYICAADLFSNKVIF